MLTTENHNSCCSQQKMMHKTLTNKQTSTVNLIQVFRFKSWIFCCNDGNSECCSHEIENHLRLHQNFQLQLFHFVKSLSVTLCLTPGNEWVITNCQMRCWRGERREGRAGSDGISPHIGRKAIQGLCADFQTVFNLPALCCFPCQFLAQKYQLILHLHGILLLTIHLDNPMKENEISIMQPCLPPYLPTQLLCYQC